jgi:hypothetical protein
MIYKKIIFRSILWWSVKNSIRKDRKLTAFPMWIILTLATPTAELLPRRIQMQVKLFYIERNELLALKP